MKTITTLLLLFITLAVFSQDVEMYIEEDDVFVWDIPTNSPKKIGAVTTIKGEYAFTIGNDVFFIKLTKKEWVNHIYMRTGATTREKVGKLYVENKKQYPDIWTIKLDKDLRGYIIEDNKAILTNSKTSSVSLDPFKRFAKSQLRRAGR